MKYRITFSRKASSYLRRVDAREQRRIGHALRSLQEDPRHEGTKALHGVDARSLRIGNLRIIYLIDEPGRFVHVDRIGPRGQVYRDLS